MKNKSCVATRAALFYQRGWKQSFSAGTATGSSVLPCLAVQKLSSLCIRPLNLSSRRHEEAPSANDEKKFQPPKVGRYDSGGQSADVRSEKSCRSEEHTSELQSLRHLVC